MEKKFEPTPELRERIQGIKDSLAHSEASIQLSVEDLGTVSGGGPFDRPPLDPNKEIGGWTYTDLHDLLCWVYESYGSVDITIGVANDLFPSALWAQYSSYPYPAFIDLPMWKYWCPNAFGT